MSGKAKGTYGGMSARLPTIRRLTGSASKSRRAWRTRSPCLRVNSLTHLQYRQTLEAQTLTQKSADEIGNWCAGNEKDGFSER